ncbi:hypothetical protein [Longitalea arenae]|uniref:hypothetical protein n=1 Tax=Longitalea arenae TaxID=2812558 RepID=UPI0019684EFD|nr:hypothetical protein [Longitalea arenae]
MHTSDLTQTELKLLEAVKRGELVDFSIENESPIPANTWGEERIIRAQIIVELFISQTNDLLVHPKGVRIKAARITGRLDFEDLTLKFPLILKNCWFDEDIVLTGADAVLLNFSGSRVRNVFAERLNLKGTLFVNDGFVCEGLFELRDSYIGRSVNAQGAQFKNGSKTVFNGRRMVVHGGVYFALKFSSIGEIDLIDAKIGGTVSFNGATLENPSGYTLIGDRAVIKGGLYLNEKFTSNGKVSLILGQISGGLVCDEAIFVNPGKGVLNAAGISVAGAVIFSRAVVKGTINISFATVGGTIDFAYATLECPGGMIFDAQELTTKSTIFLGKKFKGIGSINLIGANIGGALICKDSQFMQENGEAFNATRVNIKHDFIFESSKIEGSLILSNGEIGGDFYMARVCSEGLTVLTGLKVEGDLNCSGASFKKKDNNDQIGWKGFRTNNIVFVAAGIDVKRTFHWRDIQIASEGMVVLLNGKVGQLFDDLKSWPSKGKLIIENFSYSSFHNSVINIRERIEWLRRQEEFSPQPYEQVVKVLRSVGHDKYARRVARAKQNDLRKRGKLGIPEKCWNLFLDVTIGHGYQVYRILIAAAIITILGTIVFSRANQLGIMTPVKETQPGFNAFIYSLDVFLPIVDLKQEVYWLPIHGGSFYMTYYWVHIFLGWLITTLAVVGLTGIVKKD